MAQKTAVVVLNIGGQAASAVSGLLGILGGDAPLSASHGRECAIARFNQALLQSSNQSLHHWTGFNRQWLSSPKAAEFLGRALDLVRVEFDGSYLIIFDDPGMARLLPFWSIVFEKAEIVPRYLFAMEQPADLATALQEHQDIDAGSAYLIWLRAALDAEFWCRGQLRAFVDATLLAEQPVEIIKELTATVKLTLPRDVKATLASENHVVDSLLDPVRRRSSVGGIGTANVADWVNVAQMTLAKWAKDGETEEAYYLLDAVRDAFDDASPAFIGLGATHETARRLRQLAEDLEAAQAEVVQSRELEERLRALTEQEQVRAAQVNADLASRISYLESALAQRKAEVDDTRQSLEDAGRELGAMEMKFASAQADAENEVKRLRDLVQASESAAEEAQKQLSDRYKEIVTLSRKLACGSAAAQKFERQAARLGSIASIFEHGAGRGFAARWLGWALPWAWHRRRITKRIAESGMFDDAAYLTANPDVARAGIDPLKHYLVHGVGEGRPLGFE